MEQLIFMFGSLWTAISTATPEALVKALFVLLAVVGLRWVKVIPNSSWARAANVIFSVMLSGVTTGSASPEEVAVMTLTAGFAAGVWDLISTITAAKTGKKLFAPV